VGYPYESPALEQFLKTLQGDQSNFETAFAGLVVEVVDDETVRRREMWQRLYRSAERVLAAAEGPRGAEQNAK
jgi:hypothetical protein